MRKKTVGQLNRLYNEAETVDKSLFAEQRSHILLISGEHYNDRNSRKYNQIRDQRDQSDHTKLRLTKNHTHKVHKYYVQSVMSNAKGVTVMPQLGGEIQDQKAAELNKAVWIDTQTRCKIDRKTRLWASDYCGIGEVHLKVYWDPDKGDLKGYNQKLDELGMPMVDERGQPVPDKDDPVFAGDFVHERIFGFNMLRDPGAQSFEESPYLIIRKMVNTEELKARYKDDEGKFKAIVEGANEMYIVFDSHRGGYEKSKGFSPIREYYFRPCVEYPRGYYYIATKGVILEQGELPLGLFPIVSQGFDVHQTSPRGRSIIKQARPYQAEINRASSSQALHQITIGDDKILYQAGTKLAPGSLLPGVRGITFQGMEPKILQGRDGGQYQDYINGQIKEMYDVLDVNNVMAQSQNTAGGNDLYALLFRSAAQKQQLSGYSEQFEDFLVDVCELTLELGKEYLPDDMLIPAMGMKEYVNMAEYKSSEKLRYKINVVPQDDTLETKFGKQLSFQHLLQYSGAKLGREDIGMLMRNMPFANSEEMFKKYTIDNDSTKNIMLALERGEYPQSIEEDNHEYIISELSLRIRQPDFRYLQEQIQQAYMSKRKEHTELQAQKEKKILAMQSEYIPADGPMIACDMYVENADPKKAPKRARIPQRALDWLVKHLQEQSGSLERLEEMNGGTASDMAQAMGPRKGAMGPQQGTPQQGGQQQGGIMPGAISGIGR